MNNSIDTVLSSLKFTKDKEVKSFYNVSYKGEGYTINKCSETGKWFTCDSDDYGSDTLKCAKRTLAFNLRNK